MRCQACGVRLPEGANYCPLCGAKADECTVIEAVSATHSDETVPMGPWAFDPVAAKVRKQGQNESAAAAIDFADACEETARAAEEAEAAEEALASLFDTSMMPACVAGEEGEPSVDPLALPVDPAAVLSADPTTRLDHLPVSPTQPFTMQPNKRHRFRGRD